MTDMKFDRPLPPKIGFFVIFSPMYQVEIGRVLHFFHQPNYKLHFQYENLPN